MAAFEPMGVGWNDSIHGDDARREKGRCGSCKKSVNAVVKLSLCSGCKFQMYCSTACQRTHWKGSHKFLCKYIQSEFGTEPWHRLLQDQEVMDNVFEVLTDWAVNEAYAYYHPSAETWQYRPLVVSIEARCPPRHGVMELTNSILAEGKSLPQPATGYYCTDISFFDSHKLDGNVKTFGYLHPSMWSEGRYPYWLVISTPHSSTSNFESGTSTEKKASPVHRVRFPQSCLEYEPGHALLKPSRPACNPEEIKTVLNLAFELDFRTSMQSVQWLTGMVGALEITRNQGLPPLRPNGKVHESWLTFGALERAKMTRNLDPVRSQEAIRLLGEALKADGWK